MLRAMSAPDPSSVAGSDITAHLRERYGIDATGAEELDAGVHRVARRDGPDWVARVFGAQRPLADVQSEADLLKALERGGFPAERCADPEAVSRWGERSVLVTEFVEPAAALRPRRSAAFLGGLLGALHAHSGEGRRAGGAWHHLSPTGGPHEEIAAAMTLLDDAVGEIPVRQLAAFDRLRAAVEQADDCADLPHALVHPDFVAENAIPTAEQKLVIVDWTGAGRGPRLWSLGFLLWAAGVRDPRLIDVVISRYRRRVRLEDEELDRLEGAITGRPLMLDCWSLCHGRLALADVVEHLDADRRRGRSIAAAARAAFAGE